MSDFLHPHKASIFNYNFNVVIYLQAIWFQTIFWKFKICTVVFNGTLFIDSEYLTNPYLTAFQSRNWQAQQLTSSGSARSAKSSTSVGKKSSGIKICSHGPRTA